MSTTERGRNDPPVDAADAVARVIRDPSLLRVVVQPIADLVGGMTAGYEALARLPESWQIAPEDFFAAAVAGPTQHELQALALRAALALRTDLPENCFLSVNVDPRSLAHPILARTFADAGCLGGVFVELTEHGWPADIEQVLGPVSVLRAAGARIALDDMGAGHAGLTELMQLRPELVKLDRALISCLDTDPAAQALVTTVGTLAAQLDAWVLLEGIETPAQLAVAARLDVPLGQGWLLGRPGAPWPETPTELIRHHAAAADLNEHVVALIRPVTHEVSSGSDGSAHRVLTVQADGMHWWHPATSISPSTSPTDALRRALARPAADRYCPLVVTARTGDVLGLIEVHDLMIAQMRSADDLVVTPLQRADVDFTTPLRTGAHAAIPVE